MSLLKSPLFFRNVHRFVHVFVLFDDLIGYVLRFNRKSCVFSIIRGPITALLRPDYVFPVKDPLTFAFRWSRVLSGLVL